MPANVSRTNRAYIDSTSSYHSNREPRWSHGMLNPACSAGYYNPFFFFSVGHIVEPLKGDADEEEDALQPWMCTPISVMCPRYSTAFGIGQ